MSIPFKINVAMQVISKRIGDLPSIFKRGGGVTASSYLKIYKRKFTGQQPETPIKECLGVLSLRLEEKMVGQEGSIVE